MDAARWGILLPFQLGLGVVKGDVLIFGGFRKAKNCDSLILRAGTIFQEASEVLSASFAVVLSMQADSCL